MRTLRDILLAAAEALEFAPQSDHIKIWPFESAPEKLKALSQAGGDEDWLAVVPNRILDNYHYILWLDWLGVHRVRKYPIAGATVFIGQHA